MSAATRFAPPLLLMGIIFALSAQPNLNSGLGTWDVVLRKLAHMTEYGLLFVLWWRAFRWRAPLAAALIAVAYAGTDEVHQLFVEGRHGTPVDVGIDAVGVGVGYVGVRLFARRRRRLAAA